MIDTPLQSKLFRFRVTHGTQPSFSLTLILILILTLTLTYLFFFSLDLHLHLPLETSMDDDLKLADWSEIHVDLLFLITDKLKSTFSLSEYIRFGAVCFEWRSFCIQNYKEQIKLPSNLPLLLIPIPIPIPNPSHKDDTNTNKQVILQDDDFSDDNQSDEEEEEELEILQDDFDDDNHEDDDEDEDEDDEEEEQLEDHFYGMIIVPKPPQEDYYTPKDIWKGQDAKTRYKNTRSFYSLSPHRKVYQDFQLPVPYYNNCRGSSHGWLITVDEEEQPDGTYIYPVRLLNPFRSLNNQIQLPPLTPIPVLGQKPNSSYYLLKAYLSANPSSLSNPSSSKDLLVLGVYGTNQLIFCRPGDSAWTYVPVEDKFRPIEDLICYKSRFLAIIQNGSVLELDFAHHLLHPKLPSVKFFALPPANGNIFDKKYLVESGGDLLQVERHHVDYSTTRFRAFKLKDSNDDDDNWVEMENNLDGRMLFLGDNSSISLSAADFPGLMPNCVYFTDDDYIGYELHDWEGPHDIGIFNFEDKSVVLDPGPIMPPPIWIQPML